MARKVKPRRAGQFLPGYGTDWHVPASHCPACGHRTNALGRLPDDARPKPGDLSVCIECLSVSEIGEDFRMTIATPDRLAGLAPEEAAEVRQTQALLAAARAAWGGTPRAH